MQLLPGSVSAGIVPLSLFALFLLFCGNAQAHNITTILAKDPQFSTFNHYLTITHLANEINLRQTITVCAVDNAGMSDLLAKGLSVYAIKNVLSLHVLLDYFGSQKLHQIANGSALAATMYQATGSAPGVSGFVNITDLKGGKVGFSAGSNDDDGDVSAMFVKSVEEIPYNISVIQISQILPSEEAEAPTPGPSEQNLTALMSAHGCKVFADTLLASDALKTYDDNLEGGLTVFCPMDDAYKNFLPKYKNLTADGKLSLLLYHAFPVYESLPMLKSGNGLMNTLATDGADKYDLTVQNDGEEVTLRTNIVTARITGTLLDEQPLAIYTIDKVLLPKELFKAEAPAPSPAPAPKADAPPTKKKSSPPAPDSPVEAPSEDPAEQKADDSGSIRYNGGRFAAPLLLSSLLGLLVL